MTDSPESLGRVVTSWVRSLHARNLADKTLRTYGNEVRQLAGWLDGHADLTGWEQVTRGHLEDYLVHLQGLRKPSSVSTSYRAMQQFFKWAAEEDEVDANPMSGMRPPVVPEQPVPVLTETQIKTLLKTCEGKGFTDRRDAAVIRLFLDTGMRLNELVTLTVGRVDVDARDCFVHGKGRRPRTVAFGARTATALDRYLRVRDRHPMAGSDALWLAKQNKPLGEYGVRRMLERRARWAGNIPNLHPHMFRHTTWHYARLEGRLHDDEIMQLAGWKSRQMLSRYSASAAQERALSAGKRTALGDNL